MTLAGPVPARYSRPEQPRRVRLPRIIRRVRAHSPGVSDIAEMRRKRPTRRF